MNILFDLDGTLVDSAPDIRAAVNRVLAGAGLAPMDQPRVTGFVGDGTAMLIRRVIAAAGVAENCFEEWHRAFLHHYGNEMLCRTRPYPGVVAALSALRGQGLRMGICTNKPEAPARTILAATDLAPMIEVVVGGDTLAERKPSPRPLWYAARLLGGPVAFVGDSEVDAAAAEAAGLPFLLFSGGYRKTPAAALPYLHVFDHFDELPGLVRSLGRLATVDEATARQRQD